MVTLSSVPRGWPVYRTSVAALVVAAWVALAVWAASPYGDLLDHRGLGEEHHLPLIELLPVFLVGWALMVVAMMLPASIHTLKALLTSAPAGRNRSALLTWFTAGYISVWLVYGIAAYLGDSALHEMVETGVVPEWAASGLLAGVLLMAGLYQFTPAKRACLAACLPGAAHYEPRTGESGQPSPFWLGIRQGLVCMGSCWSLMLVMFALGGVQLGWMVLLTAIMTAESISQAGSRLRWPLGLALMACGALLLVF